LRPGPSNPPVYDNDSGVSHRRATRTVDECETIEYRGFGKRCAGRKSNERSEYDSSHVEAGL
jgi:hypothetical protein